MLPALDMTLSIEDLGGVALGPIQTVKDGLRFLADGEGEGVDVAILDVDLHGQEVFPVAEVLRERGVPFLFHTGHPSRPALRTQFPDAPVLTKPTMMNELLDVVGGLLPTRAS